MNTGKRIKERRKELGKSAEWLAAECDVSPATIYRYEKGDIENMRTDKLEPIAKALKTTPSYLMGWDDDPIDYDDGDLIASIPLNYVEACGGDIAKAYAMMKAVDNDVASENKKSPSTLIDTEGLSEDKRELIEYVMSLSDVEARVLRGMFVSKTQTGK